MISMLDTSRSIVVWDAIVVPRLEIHLYRKRFRAVQSIGLEKTRAAVVARALARIALTDVKSEYSRICIGPLPELRRFFAATWTKC
jgi:hypothetical protein